MIDCITLSKSFISKSLQFQSKIENSVHVYFEYKIKNQNRMEKRRDRP